MGEKSQMGEKSPMKLRKIAVSEPGALQVKKLSDNATVPSRGSAKAAGYDLSRYTRCLSRLRLTVTPCALQVVLQCMWHAHTWLRSIGSKFMRHQVVGCACACKLSGDEQFGLRQVMLRTKPCMAVSAVQKLQSFQLEGGLSSKPTCL